MATSLALALAMAAVTACGGGSTDAQPSTNASATDVAEAALALKADEKAPFGKIMQVLDELKTAGVQNLPAFTRATK